MGCVKYSLFAIMAACLLSGIDEHDLGHEWGYLGVEETYTGQRRYSHGLSGPGILHCC